jgi:secretion/DNA translocation related TadE-like protein
MSRLLGRCSASCKRALRAAGRESGQSTAAALGVIGALLALSVGALDLARAVSTAHVARSAADLAALAGAGASVRGSGAGGACVQAAHVASVNHAAVVACVVQLDGCVRVTVTATSGGPWPRRARASARAGPG